VKTAEPDVEGFGQIVAKDGKALQVNGPRSAGNWLADAALNPYRLVGGRAPAGSGEVVLNRGAAEAAGLRIGDSTTLLTPAPRPVTIVGIATYGDADAFGGTSYVGLSYSDAQRYMGTGLTSIRVRGAGSPAALAHAVAAVLPPGVQAVTGQVVTDEANEALGAGFLTALRAVLGSFAAVALLVAVLSIHNTFAILVAQRTRETALLRAVGASRRQVLTGVVAEASVIGLVASAFGVAAGFGLAALLKQVFAAIGFAFPAAKLVFPLSAVAICLPAGVLITLVAALAPALRAARVAPVEALRGAAAESTRPSLVRLVLGALAFAGGGLAAALGGSLVVVGPGALLTVAGAIALAPLAVRWLGVPARNATAALAGQNARRSPRRTAGAAAALVIGVGVVTLFTVAAGSIGTASTSATAAAFDGDLAITGARFGNGGLSPGLAPALARVPQVSTVAAVDRGQAVLAGQPCSVSVGIPSALASVIDFHDVRGVAIGGLRAGQIAVTDDEPWKLGQRVAVRYPDGALGTVTVSSVYATNPLVSGVLFTSADWTPHARQQLTSEVYLSLASGVSLETGRSAVATALRPYGSPTLSDAEELAGADAAAIDQVLNLVYVLLAVAILTALMGIANTLSLAIGERTRELGLLRAVGATRRQVRTLVRWESALVALFGTGLGAALGVALGWALVRAADLGDFSVPPAPLVVIVAGGALAGLLAGALPARRAARLDVLRAIATE
jgi:putative ABC transport system permease protein